jgi:TonB-linked SusC/RagA family outer membrane protein
MKNCLKKMKMLLQGSLFIPLFLLFVIAASAQTKVVTGTVVNGETNLPIANISVRVKGTSKGTSTDANGAFKIEAAENALLEITSIGYKATEVPADFTAPMQVKLEVLNQTLTDVVVVGYGTKKRSDITGSVSSVSKERLSQLPVTNALQAIQGSVAGVNITTGSSVPGASSKALVRGSNSISAATDPFVVVDGVPFYGSFNDINPSDIASIDILKDVSSVAIYGTRGANGVILITTKRGKTGKAAISYNVYAGIEDYANTVKPMSPEQYVQKYADYRVQANVTNPAVLPNAFEQANHAAGITTDWLDKISQQGTIQNHTLSISGGSKDVKYYVSGDYLKQKGVIKGYQYNRASLRSNIDATITDFLTAGLNLFLTSNNYDGGRASLTAASQLSPYGTFAKADGSYEVYPMSGELLYTNAILGLTTARNERSKNISTNVYAELKPGFAKGLRYRINAAYSYAPTLFQSYIGRPAGNQLGLAQVDNGEKKNWVIENILTYEKNWGKHHADVTGLYSAQETRFTYNAITASGFINDILEFNNLSAAASVSAIPPTPTTTPYKSNLLSQMLRINYTYDSRYLFTATARRDGYSAFGSNTSKYGMFPSVALGWNISNENFMKNSKFINNLKLRGSYGLSGNQGIEPNGTTSTASTVRLPYNGLSTIGVVANVLGNNNLNWESTYGSNVGIDFTLFNNRISGTIEAYSTKTKDLLLFRSIPTITGYIKVFDNLGKVSNKGFEFSVKTQNLTIKDFKWETSLNFSTNKNKILDLYGDGKDDPGNFWFIGKPISVIYDYKLEGVWQTGESPANQDPIAKPGDLKFSDVNGSKTLTVDDRTIIGQTTPKWIGGITNTFHYKNFHLNIFIQTAQGITKNNPLKDFRDLGGRQNLPAEVSYWTAANQNNTRPSLAYNNSKLYGYAEDASYTRIKDITLSYVASKSLLDKVKLGGLTFYVSGRNLATFTNWVGWDPEADFDRAPVNANTNANNSYPLVRSIIFGANITLR